MIQGDTKLATLAPQLLQIYIHRTVFENIL